MFLKIGRDNDFGVFENMLKMGMQILATSNF